LDIPPGQSKITIHIAQFFLKIHSCAMYLDTENRQKLR
jgi:hypothetical protein